MEPMDTLLARLDALEIKACQADDQLDALNLTVFRQQQQIDRLQNQLALLRQQLADPAQAAPRNPQDDIPPHY